MKAARVLVKGVVQGVGFRPTVRRIAVGLGLVGSVRNTSEGVLVEIEGEDAAVDAFAKELSRHAPPLSRIDSIEVQPAQPRGTEGFCILHSEGSEAHVLLVPPDIATCDACLTEMRDPADRRYRYPFINCTDCGPRFTIIEDLPYDRPLTTMSGFAMCEDCAREYSDPSDRRFHAQPIACPACGPRVRYRQGEDECFGDEALRRAGELLDSGGVLAVKGLGGFHLACDACSPEAVDLLRSRKGRPEGKPFAIMVRDVDTARRWCAVDRHEEAMLSSPERPIVLLRRLGDDPVAGGVAPGTGNLGVMLPYTPVHHLLLDAVRTQALVMTSGNIADEPIVTANDEAGKTLGHIADAFLDHDRPIRRRCDDSVACSLDGAPVLLRRSRGYAPLPVRLGLGGPSVFAAGGDLKAAFCLTRGEDAFVSQHIGDLEALGTYEFYGQAMEDLCGLLSVEPKAVACDLHPRYFSRRFAEELAARRGLPLVEVQHHHAHAASVLAEHAEEGPVIAMIMDGTGYGSDGTVWGAEILLADLRGFRRLGHMLQVPIPGADAAVAEPWRMGVSWLVAAYNGRLDRARSVMCEQMRACEVEAVCEMIKTGVGAPSGSSCGRLFDAVASILGVRQHCTFEAQAAMELEAVSGDWSGDPYPWELRKEKGMLVFDPRPMIRRLAEEAGDGRPTPECAGRFHDSLAAGLAEMCAALCEQEGMQHVALSGGCFQNRRFVRGVRDRLESKGLRVLLHRLVPPNDGGISLGQAAVALAGGG